MNGRKHLSLLKKLIHTYFLMKINNMRLVFQNNVFLVYFPVKKHQKTLNLTLGVLIFQFQPSFWAYFIILYPAEEIGGIGFERGRFLVLVGNGLSFFFYRKSWRCLNSLRATSLKTVQI